MKRFLSLTLVLMTAILVTGCPKKPTIVKEEAKAPAADIKVQEEKARKEAEERARAEAEAKARTEKEAEDRAKKETEEKARKEAEAVKAFRVEDIHFDYDRYDIKERDRETLKSLAEWLQNNKDVKIEVEGHCDERGSNDYNLALGERRAHSVEQYLVTLGVNGSMITSLSYGEEKPLCAESTEDCWWKNRRVHFAIKDAS
ncbi:MAG: peptidoglycan-associated lipoprotein Pal [Deltaproteobacteria bacterium]|nr:peptidoglycan-associated lipoprotein Pal [Deltaproteobacteria bacterium]